MSKIFTPNRTAILTILTGTHNDKRRTALELLAVNGPNYRENLIVAALVALYRYESVEVGLWLLDQVQPTAAEIDTLASTARIELLEAIGFSWLTLQGCEALRSRGLPVPQWGDEFMHP